MQKIFQKKCRTLSDLVYKKMLSLKTQKMHHNIVNNLQKKLLQCLQNSAVELSKNKFKIMQKIEPLDSHNLSNVIKKNI